MLASPLLISPYCEVIKYLLPFLSVDEYSRFLIKLFSDLLIMTFWFCLIKLNLSLFIKKNS